MVHTFTQNTTNIAFDQESGALHVLDDISFAVLKLYVQNGGRRPPQEALDKIARAFSEDPDSCCEDIEELIAQQSLFAPAKTYAPDDFYADEPRIKAMCLHVSHDCNLRCKYCFAHTGDFGTGKRKVMDLKTGKKAVDFVIRQSGARRNIDIDFFGGEPLMNWEVVKELTAYCEEEGPKNGKNIRLTITTNAIGLDDEKTSFLNEHMNNCVLSLDGRPQVNDRMRPFAGGRGSYDRVAENIKKFVMKRGNRSYYVRGTYTKHNLDFSEDVRHIVSLGVAEVSVEPVVGPPEADYSLKEEDLPAIFKEYEKLAAFYVGEHKAGRPFHFFHFMMDLSNGPCAYKRLKGCGVGSEYIAVTPDGEIYPCHQLVGEKRFLMGNILDDPDALDPNVRASFRDLLVPQKSECRDCWAKYFCSGGCPANAYFSTGDVRGTYKLGCEIQKKRLECALWIKTQLS